MRKGGLVLGLGDQEASKRLPELLKAGLPFCWGRLSSMSDMMGDHCRRKIAGGLGRHGLATSVGQHEQRFLPGPASPP